MALHRAGITDAGGIVGVGGIRRRWVACEASENALAQRTKGFGAVFDALREEYG